MFTEINEGNREDIVKVCRSYFVCLQIMLTQTDIEVITAKSKQEICANIVSLLKNQDFLLSIIPVLDSELFKERVGLISDHSLEIQNTVNALIAAIKNCDERFMQQFVDLIGQQEEQTKFHCEKFIEILTQIEGQHQLGQQTYCENTYANHHNNCCCMDCFNPFEYLEEGFK